jgi:hypothetical protein
MIRIGVLIAGASLVARLCCAQTLTPQEAAFARRIAGCYEVRPGSWQTDSALLALAHELGTWSTRFRLTATVLPAWERWRDSQPVFQVVEYPTGAQVRDTRRNWQRIDRSSDSVRLTAPLVLHEAGIVFRATAPPFTGYAYSGGDNVFGPYVRHPIELKRAKCP